MERPCARSLRSVVTHYEDLRLPHSTEQRMHSTRAEAHVKYAYVLRARDATYKQKGATWTYGPTRRWEVPSSNSSKSSSVALDFGGSRASEATCRTGAQRTTFVVVGNRASFVGRSHPWNLFVPVDPRLVLYVSRNGR